MATKNHHFDEYMPTHLIYSHHSIARFYEMGPEIFLPKNHFLQKAGNVPDSCYVLKKGRIACCEYTADGRECYSNINEEGSLLFEAAIILERRLTLNYKALTDCKLIKIPRKVLMDGVVSDPAIALDLLSSVSEKFLSVSEQIRQSNYRSATWKVCNLMLTLADKYGVNYDGKVMISERISQQQLANTLRINRVTVNRTLTKLKYIGYIEQINGFFCIRSIDKLRRYMDSISDLSEE